MLLENLTVVKSKAFKNVKVINQEELEKYLIRELQFTGENRLNQIRDEAREIAVNLKYEKEFNQLNRIISALLSTQDAEVLKTPYAISILKKEPYDENRLNTFEILNNYLRKCVFKQRPYQFTKDSYKNLSFFESYFSNFIEGTEFTVDEAEDIVFKGTEVYQRHADSHDILANFHLSNDISEMSKTSTNFSEFIEILKKRHAYLMRERSSTSLYRKHSLE